MRRTLLVSLLLVLAMLTAYWPVHEAGFLNFDDNQYITNNPRVFQGLTLASVQWAFTTFHAANWHPLTWLSHMLDCQVFGDHPAAHHWVNVGLHCTNAVLLLFLLSRMTGAFARSALVAALFALHPLHVESVAWIAERKDVLSAFFGLLALLAYATYVDRAENRKQKTEIGTSERGLFSVLGSGSARFWYVVALFLYALGLMSKPMLVTLPFLLLLLDYWPLNRLQLSALNFWSRRSQTKSDQFSVFKRLLLEKLPFLLLSLASCAITFYAQKAGGAVAAIKDVPLEARLENACLGYVFYIAKTFWPARLAVFYPYPDHFRLAGGIAAAIAMVVITVIAFRFARRWPYLLVGWLWFAGMLVPVIGLVQVGSQVAADRYTYLPLLGIFIAVVWGGGDLVPATRRSKNSQTESGTPPRFEAWNLKFLGSLEFGVWSFVLAACLIATFLQVRYWRDSVALFTHALLISPENNPIVEHNLGHALSLSGDQPAAIAHFKQAIRYRPDFPAAHLNWGNSVGAQGNVDEAIQHFQDAIRCQPSYEEAHYQLGNAWALQGKFKEAESSFREAIHFKPDYAEAFLKLANVLDLEGKTEEARSNWNAALKARPDFDEAHYYLAGSLARQKQFPDAIAHFRAAIKANPKYAAACNDLAWILATRTNAPLSNPPEAVRLAQRACELTSHSNPMYLDTLAVALSASGRVGEAADAAARAVMAASASSDNGISAQLRKHLEMFRAGEPYHSFSGAKPP